MDGEQQSLLTPPTQGRSRRTWARLLDTSVDVLTDSGPAGFTITEICRRAELAPTVVYARVGSRDALLVAAYEHGMTRVRAAEDRAFARASVTPSARHAVSAIVEVFDQFQGFLRSSVVLSAYDERIAELGAQNISRVRERFLRVAIGPDAGDAVREAASKAFTVLLGALSLQVGFGAAYAEESGPRMLESTLIAMVRAVIEASEEAPPGGITGPGSAPV